MLWKSKKKLFLALVLLAGVTAEDTGGGELTEAVANHVLGHIDGDELVAVVNCDGEADEVGRDHGSAGPRLDGGFLTGGLGFEHALFEFIVNKRSFF